MGEFASNGKANAGLTTGIIGTALGGLWALGGGNGGNGLLGNLFGNNNQNQAAMAYIDQLQAKIAEMNAEKYSNKVALEVYQAARASDAKQDARFAEVAREIADMRVSEASLRGEINTNNAATQGQIAQVASTANNGISVLSANLACLQQTVAGITKTVVPKTAVCPEPMSLYNSWTAPTNTASTSA